MVFLFIHKYLGFFIYDFFYSLENFIKYLLDNLTYTLKKFIRIFYI